MTNKIVLREMREFMADYVPTYKMLYPLLLGKSQAYPDVVGKMDFQRADTIGDIRASVLTPKDTELKQIASKEVSRIFKKYFLANQFVQSSLQDLNGVEDIVKQVLDEHQKQMDELVLFGGGTSNASVLNNGLYWSLDPNYQTETSFEVLSASGYLPSLHSKVVQLAYDADQVAGRKLVLFFGEQTMLLTDSLYSASQKPFKVALQEVLGPDYSIGKIPPQVAPPGSAQGFMIVNLDQVKLNYTVVPTLKAQGVNEEKMYVWHNFLMGSTMLEVLAAKGIIRQPLTYQA